MPTKQIEITPGLMLHEREEVVVDLKAYVDKLPYTKADVARKLDVTFMQLHGWCANGRLPRAVWKRCALLFGQQGLRNHPKVQTVRNKAYRLPAEQYAKFLGYEVIEPKPPEPIAPVEPAEPEPPAVAPRPETVPWAVHEHTVMLLMHQNTEVVRELSAVNGDNLRLAQQVELLKTQVALLTGEKGFDLVTSRQLDAVRPIRVEPTETHKEALSHLQSLSHHNGNGAVISDLEKRLSPFAMGQRPLS